MTVGSLGQGADNEWPHVSSQDNSKWRRHYLSSLYDYMHGCKKELKYLSEEQDKILKQDWSDRMVDTQDVRREYEVRRPHTLFL